MQRTKGLILPAIILLSSVSAWTQTDTSFWFAEPMFKYDERYIKNELRICTYDSTIISTQTYYYNTARQLVSHTQTDTLSAHQELGTGGESFDNQLNITNIGYGYHITTSRPVSTTFLSRAHYSLKGANALGTHFVVPAPLHDKIETIRSGIDIIATEDSTLVTIYPANPLLNLPAGPHSVTLQRGQTYYVRAASTNPSRQLGGSIVTSNHPIAVNTTSSDVKLQDRIYAPADLTGDQIVPTRLLGTRYLLPANPVLSYDEQLAIYSFRQHAGIHRRHNTYHPRLRRLHSPEYSQPRYPRHLQPPHSPFHHFPSRISGWNSATTNREHWFQSCFHWRGNSPLWSHGRFCSHGRHRSLPDQ